MGVRVGVGVGVGVSVAVALGLTVIVTWAVLTFDPHVAVRVYVVVVAGFTVTLPGVATPPMSLSISAFSAPLTKPQLRVADCPTVMVVGDAANESMTGVKGQFAAGDLRTRAAVRGEDEISRLGRSFNAMAENLERSETARRNMLADVAHELRNPLGVIQSHLEAMLDGVFPMQAEQIASLHDETLLLTRLVDDLRDRALADAGQLSLHREATDLRALVERTTEAFQAQAAEQQIALSRDRAENTPPLHVVVDAQRIEQVLRNLISNALRYTPAGGSVSVKLTREGNAARIEVSDTGPGISADALEHVFERFWRGDKSRARALGGSGLGLAIAKQWIEAHGGQIGVTTAMGGATFWFTLPL